MAAKAAIKAVVGQKALVARLNRKMAAENLSVRRPRSMQGFVDLGDWYLLNVQGNYIAEPDVNLYELGREWEVLQPWEEVEGYKGKVRQ